MPFKCSLTPEKIFEHLMNVYTHFIKERAGAQEGEWGWGAVERMRGSSSDRRQGETQTC